MSCLSQHCIILLQRMEQTENEVRTLQESCRALVELSIPDLKIEEET